MFQVCFKAVSKVFLGHFKGLNKVIQIVNLVPLSLK